MAYYIEVNEHVIENYYVHAEALIAILETIKTEISSGWLVSFKGLVTVEIFSDFLEMAEHLLKNGYKDPAAVVAGSVLEEHMRQLCMKNGIDIQIEKDDKIISKKADRLNADLAKNEVYNKLDHKAVTMCLDLRNKAANGKYDEYNKEQVQNMLEGISEFMARVQV